MKGRNHLTSSEKVKIEVLRAQNMSYVEIALEVNRNQRTVARFLKKETHSKKTERRGRKKVLSNLCKRRIKRLAAEKLLSVQQIKDELQIAASARTVSRYLQTNSGLKFGKFSSIPQLLDTHKQQRLEWATKYVDLGAK